MISPLYWHNEMKCFYLWHIEDFWFGFFYYYLLVLNVYVLCYLILVEVSSIVIFSVFYSYFEHYNLKKNIFQQMLKMKKHEELETPTFTTSIPIDIAE